MPIKTAKITRITVTLYSDFKTYKKNMTYIRRKLIILFFSKSSSKKKKNKKILILKTNQKVHTRSDLIQHQQKRKC